MVGMGGALIPSLCLSLNLLNTFHKIVLENVLMGEKIKHFPAVVSFSC